MFVVYIIDKARGFGSVVTHSTAEQECLRKKNNDILYVLRDTMLDVIITIILIDT